MRFWDTSAVVPLLIEEDRSRELRQLLASDQAIVVWWGTPVECTSALARRHRGGELTAAHLRGATTRLDLHAESWTEISASDEVREHATRLLSRHALRAADALQLGAALTWARGRPARRTVVTLDDRLAELARREGFAVDPA